MHAAQYKDVFISKITSIHVFMYIKPRIHVRENVLYLCDSG